jgi:hypothetical protein
MGVAPWSRVVDVSQKRGRTGWSRNGDAALRFGAAAGTTSPRGIMSTGRGQGPREVRNAQILHGLLAPRSSLVGRKDTGGHAHKRRPHGSYQRDGKNGQIGSCRAIRSRRNTSSCACRHSPLRCGINGRSTRVRSGRSRRKGWTIHVGSHALVRPERAHLSWKRTAHIGSCSR